AWARLGRDVGGMGGEAPGRRGRVLELLDASQVEQGSLVGRREEVDLAELARAACARHHSARHACQVDADGPVVLQGDLVRLSQLVENLVENAVKYSPDGGPGAGAVRGQAGTAELTVADRGIGIPADDLPHLFDRFRRASNVDDRRFAGMGLGLYICRGIVEGHGGRIWATSAPGRGATFHVELP